MEHARRRSRGTAGEVDARGHGARLARVRLLARLLDSQFAIPGTPYRIGIDPLLGLVPVVGDFLATILSSWILVTAARMGAPAPVLAQMAVNVAVDAFAGSVPVVGDLFDAGYKANLRNYRLLESWAGRPGPTRRTSRTLLAAVVFGVLLIGAATLFAAWKLFAWMTAARAT